MDYDQERTYLRGSCLDYDTRDTLRMMFDMAFEPKSGVAADVARAKNQKAHDLQAQLAEFDPFSDVQELLLRTAFGSDTIGMPRLGQANNVGNINESLL